MASQVNLLSILFPISICRDIHRLSRENVSFSAWTTKGTWFKVCWPVKNEINHMTLFHVIYLLIIFFRFSRKESLFHPDDCLETEPDWLLSTLAIISFQEAWFWGINFENAQNVRGVEISKYRAGLLRKSCQTILWLKSWSKSTFPSKVHKEICFGGSFVNKKMLPV